MDKRFLTPKEFADKAEDLIKSNDSEEGHLKTDKLMEDVLSSLGYEKGVEIIRGRREKNET